MREAKVFSTISSSTGFVTVQFGQDMGWDALIFVGMKGASTTTPVIIKVGDTTNTSAEVAALSSSGGYLGSVNIYIMVVPTS